MAQPAEHTISSLPGQCCATLDSNQWWVVNIPAATSMVVVNSAELSADNDVWISFDTSISNADVTTIPSNDGTIHNFLQYTGDETGQNGITINLKPNGPARTWRGLTDQSTIQMAVAGILSNHPISVTVS